MNACWLKILTRFELLVQDPEFFTCMAVQLRILFVDRKPERQSWTSHYRRWFPLCHPQIEPLYRHPSLGYQQGKSVHLEIEMYIVDIF